MKILVINPGSTSTKIAIYEGETPVYAETIRHAPADLAPFPGVLDQLDYRKELILRALDKAGYRLSDLDGISARGGFTKPVTAGTYTVDEDVVEAMHHPVHEHASNLGTLLAWELKKACPEKDIPAFFVDPVSVDEITDVARVTGFAGIERQSFFHALNHRGMARVAAAQLGKKYEDCDLVVCHLGGGITSAAHHHGRAVEVCNIFEEGCFSMDRPGGLPVHAVVDLCFSGRSKEDIVRQLDTASGVVSYLGTQDFREVEEMAFDKQDPKARRIFDALAYQLAKDIGALSAVLSFHVDAIVLTGGMAYSQRFTDAVSAYVKSIAPIIVLPGESEMLSLCQGALRVLSGEETAKKF